MGCITSRLALCPMLLLHPKQRERATRLMMKMVVVVVVAVSYTHLTLPTNREV